MKHELLRWLFAGGLAIGLAACDKPPNDSADIVFTNARAYTLNEKMPWAEALAVRGNRIIFVGDNVGAEKLIGKNTVHHDLSGRMMLPGFIDSHMHPAMAGGFMHVLTLDPSGTIEDWLREIGDYAGKNPNLPVIFGYGFMASAFGLAGPSRETIDALVPDRPVLILDEGMHGAWANSRALEQLNVTRDTPDPVPGLSYYKRDAEGTATGYLLEPAVIEPAMAGLSVFTADSVADGVETLFRIMNAYGVTAAFDAGPFNVEHLVQPVLKQLAHSNKITVRIVGSYFAMRPKETGDVMRLASEYLSAIKGEYYDYRVFKILDDGTVEGRTAAMFEDYQGEPGNSGATLFSERQLTDMVVGSAERHFDVHIHALGERTVHEALNAIEAARKAWPDSSSRYTICHIQVITDQDLPRFADLDVIAQSTPLWASYDEHGRQFVSEDQFNRFWRFRSLRDLGVRLTFGSDFPASGAGQEGLSPVLQIEIGHTRQYPGERDAPIQPLESERLDIDTLIRGYTINAAYQLHMEDEIGSLEVGKNADLVVLDRNLFDTDPYEIHETQVLMTLMDGRVVYTRSPQ